MLTRTLVLAALVAAACAIMPLLNEYLLYVATISAIFGILAVSFDILLGYTGYLSIAHGVFFGIGAYFCGYLTTRYDINFWVALPLCGLLACAIGAVVALLAFRTRGLYFAVLTLGIGLIGQQIFFVWKDVTGGVNGLAGIPGMPQPEWLTVRPSVYYAMVSFILLGVTYLAGLVYVRSRLGSECIAVREDITLAKALGIRVAGARLSAFAFSAFFAGLAGAVFASISSFVAPESFGVMGTGFQLVALVVVGGMGTLWGPVLGAVLLTALPEALRVASAYSLLAYGIFLLIFMIFAPRGIAGLLKSLFGQLTARRAANPTR